jgi:hypothetical protein
MVGRRPWSPEVPATPWPESRSFYQDSLSIIATRLPSEKNRKPAGTPLADEKKPGFIDSRRIPAQK